jgi:hypothetical protein
MRTNVQIWLSSFWLTGGCGRRQIGGEGAATGDDLDQTFLGEAQEDLHHWGGAGVQLGGDLPREKPAASGEYVTQDALLQAPTDNVANVRRRDRGKRRGK